MDPYHLFLIFLSLYIAAMIAVGAIFSGRQRSAVDFWLAGRELQAPTIGFAAAASWLTASALLLATGLFLFLGVGSIWIWVFPNVFALLIISLLVKRIKNIPAMTQPELMEIRYNPSVRAPVALAIAVIMILFSVVDFIGFKLVLSTFFGVEPSSAVLLMAAAVAIYVSLGGLRAVVWTDRVQFIFLAGLAVIVAGLAIWVPITNGISLSAVTAGFGADWWNLFALGGISGALILQLALLPGWVAEQDPWQKIWAARDERSARRGLIIGSALLALVYLACFVTAIGLRALYPLPAGEIEAEMLYLRFMSEHLSPVAIAALTIGFAAASMSCTDTFATSGASCISRDIVQRHLRPDATMREMMIINRALVVTMISISAFIALNVDSIMEAVIIATVIGTTSYFFPIIGGLYWSRATSQGALAALIAGGGAQIALIAYEKAVLKVPLDTLSPFLTEHGVLVGLILSAVCFVAVSLATPSPDQMRLAPFFPEIAASLFGRDMICVDRENSRYRQVLSMIEQRSNGERSHLNLYLNLEPVRADGGEIKSYLSWDGLVQRLVSAHARWYTPTGSHTVYRLSQPDLLACVKMLRGDTLQIWLSSEPKDADLQRQKDEMYLACEEIEDVLLEMGLTSSLVSGK